MSNTEIHRYYADLSTDGVLWYRVCGRCGTDTDHLSASFHHVTRCPFARGDWLCAFCWDAHRFGCPACRAGGGA